MLKRISAVVIKDKKILLVTGYDESFYWTPGGKAEKNEREEDALKREIKEELNLNIISLKKCMKYIEKNITTKEPMEVCCYLVETSGILKPQKEITKFIWAKKEDILSKKIILEKNIRDNLFPKLIRDNLKIGR